MSYRKLEINGETWGYSVGKGAKIRSPKGKSVWIDGWELLGFENKRQYQLNSGGDGYYDDCVIPITPAVIRKYIEEKLI